MIDTMIRNFFDMRSRKNEIFIYLFMYQKLHSVFFQIRERAQ